ncbi:MULTISPECIES: hypothetical protein [Halorussus]|nr:hypothetical protein [Halorussus vallis]
MSNSTRFTCPNCDERHSIVVQDDSKTTHLDCPNCGESVVPVFG